MKELIKLQSGTLRYIGVELKNPHHVTIPEGVTVIIGPNGSGKSTLGRIIEKGWNIMTNAISSAKGKPSITYVEFNDIHSLSGCHVEYYQQRNEATMNDEVPTVKDIMSDKIDLPLWDRLCRQLNIDGIENKKLNYLSSGELRKLLIINTLMSSPDIIIIDNPYIGLDAPSRKLLDEAVAGISASGTSVIMLLCNPNELPPCTDTVIPLTGLTIGVPIACSGNVEALRSRLMSLMDFAIDTDRLPKSPHKPATHEVTLQMNCCNVRYGNRHIIKNESWKILNGECWALAGPNGCGKSVLLSLIYADNPQAYSNDIVIFDRTRGTGESIWDIKSRIGYVSPEMHLYFRHNGTVAEVIAQGLSNTSGNFARITPLAKEAAWRWIDLFHLEKLAERRYNTLSTGEQRLVLIARTLIKHPDLLIFDEPLHGLDSARKRSVKAAINSLVKRDKLTLIYVTHFLPEVPECVTHTKTLQKLKNV